MKRREGGRSQATLIAGYATEEPREHAKHTNEWAARLPVPCPTGELCEGRQDQQPSKHASKRARTKPRVDQSSAKRAGGTQDAERLQNRAINLSTQAPAADRGRKRMRQRHRRDRDARAEFQRKQRSQHAANAESDDTGRCAGENGDEE